MTTTLSVTKRESLGSNFCKQMRKAGNLPGVVYGEKKDSIPVTVVHEDFIPLLRHKGVIELDLGTQKENVMIKSVHYNAFGDKVLHVDFLRVALDKKIRLTVPLRFLGTPKGVKAGGRLDIQMRELEISCLHHQIPKEMEVSIEELDSGEQIRVQDLQVPAEVDVESHLKKTVAIVHIPRGEKGKKKDEDEEEAS